MIRPKDAAALLVLLVGGFALLVLLSALPSPSTAIVDTPWIGPSLWEVRGLDMAIQALLILAGVLGVLLILGGEEEAG
jgi:hypothetical protein